jgi:hypothetical protein
MRKASIRPAVAAAALAWSVGASFAQDAAAPAPEPEIEPAAIAAVKQMGEFLRSLGDVQFEAKITRDEVLDSGQTIQRQQAMTAYVRPPTGLRINVTSAERERQFYYDGKTLTIFGPRTMYYASVDAPPTIREMVTAVAEKYDLEMPLSDLFLWGTDEEDEAAIVGAFRVGVDRFGNRLCDSYAFHQEDVDWEVWIARGTEPLPCKLVVTDRTDEARPQFSAELEWMLDPTFGDVVFEFTPPRDAQRIELLAAQPATETQN